MRTLIVLLGPTGVGKTELSLKIAQRLGSPILSADSRQIYRDIPIGTAAPTREQQQAVRHYFVGTMPLEAYFSAAQYEAEVMALLPKLFNERDCILMCGGSMLYIDAVCKGIDDIPTVDEATRQMMQQRLQDVGLDTLLGELRLLDPTTYQRIDHRNTRRIVHALEICYQTGRPYSSFLSHAHKERPFRIIRIGLMRERADLFNRINRRVDLMLQEGLEQEARHVYPLRHLNSLNTVGYKEMFRYLDGEWTLTEAADKIRRNTRVYAKKQMTWFKRDSDIHWFAPEDEQGILRFIGGV